MMDVRDCASATARLTLWCQAGGLALAPLTSTRPGNPRGNAASRPRRERGREPRWFVDVSGLVITMGRFMAVTAPGRNALRGRRAGCTAHTRAACQFALRACKNVQFSVVVVPVDINNEIPPQPVSSQQDAVLHLRAIVQGHEDGLCRVIPLHLQRDYVPAFCQL